MQADRDLLERMETENRLAFSRETDDHEPVSKKRKAGNESGNGRSSHERRASELRALTLTPRVVSQGPTKEQAEGDFAAGVESIEKLKNVRAELCILSLPFESLTCSFIPRSAQMSKVIDDTQQAQAIAEDAGNLE